MIDLQAKDKFCGYFETWGLPWGNFGRTGDQSILHDRYAGQWLAHWPVVKTNNFFYPSWMGGEVTMWDKVRMYLHNVKLVNGNLQRWPIPWTSYMHLSQISFHTFVSYKSNFYLKYNYTKFFGAILWKELFIQFFLVSDPQRSQSWIRSSHAGYCIFIVKSAYIAVISIFAKKSYSLVSIWQLW